MLIGALSLFATFLNPALDRAAVPRPSQPALSPRGAPIGGCRAVDGDTVRCGRERIRLIGIDAPEMPGHCRRGRRCVAGDSVASKASLTEMLRGPLRIERMGRDRYGRTLALMTGALGDLSCGQVRARRAQYVAKWDEGARLRATCRQTG